MYGGLERLMAVEVMRNGQVFLCILKVEATIYSMIRYEV